MLGLYWTMPQQLAHATSNGASVRTGDLMASGTISGPSKGSEGSLIELTRNGAERLTLESGAERTFLEDGDEVVLRAAQRTASSWPRRAGASGARRDVLDFRRACPSLHRLQTGPGMRGDW